MIFNTFTYYCAFLLPTALLFRSASAPWRPVVLVVSGSLFFLYFAYTELGGAVGALCIGIFLWEASFSRLYKPGSAICMIGIVQAILFLVAFKYWNFLVSAAPTPVQTQLRWDSAFLPLGISFFTFEFIHFAVDRYRGKAEPGGYWEYFSFIMFFPTMVAGPIKRYQDFLPKLREAPHDFASDLHMGTTRILVGLVKKFAVADFMTSLSSNLNAGAIATAPRPLLLVWILVDKT
jgi:alginate O-acetyltransferase complex protein AlgI